MSTAAFEGARYACPVCGHPAATLAAKKAHIRTEHPRKKGNRRG